MQHDVDLVEGEPVFHQTVKFFETGAGVAGEEIHHLAVARGAILRHQMHRHIEVAQGDQRLNVVLLHSSNTARDKAMPSLFGSGSSPFG